MALDIISSNSSVEVTNILEMMAGCGRNVATLKKAFPDSEITIVDAANGMIKDSVRMKRVRSS